MVYKKVLTVHHHTLKNLRGNEQICSVTHLFCCLANFDKHYTTFNTLWWTQFTFSSVLWWHVQKLSLKIDMSVQLQHDAFGEHFKKELLISGNEKMTVDKSMQRITLLTSFCKITTTTDELIHNIILNIVQNYKNRQWLDTRVILAVKND